MEAVKGMAAALDDNRSWSSEARCIRSVSGVRVTSRLYREQQIRFEHDLLRSNAARLLEYLDDVPCLFVMTPTIARLYGEQLAAALARSPRAPDWHRMVLSCVESDKEFPQALKICEEAKRINLRRGAKIVGIGGGVCLDIVGFAASIYRRGVRHIKIPTTLIGLIDAGIGIKNGLNVGKGKSLLGSFYPPEYSLLDRTFLRTLDARLIGDGLAESLKMAVIADSDLFGLIEINGKDLLENRLQEDAGRLIIEKSVCSMVSELTENLYELDGYQRKVDFGHTFSPFIEVASAYTVSHGRAVAIDMAISTLIARAIGTLESGDARRILGLLRALRLPVFPTGVDAAALYDSLHAVVAHRNGHLNLVVPSGIGQCQFLRDVTQISPQLLRDVLDELRTYEV